MRRVDPTVSLPYWDCTLDYHMDNPVNSVLWTERFFGNGAGIVSTGPFSEWVTANGRLERSFGQKSRLVSRDDVTNTLSKCYFAVKMHFIYTVLAIFKCRLLLIFFAKFARFATAIYIHVHVLLVYNVFYIDLRTFAVKILTILFYLHFNRYNIMNQDQS